MKNNYVWTKNSSVKIINALIDPAIQTRLQKSKTIGNLSLKCWAAMTFD